ncbi:MAG: ATP-binding cassette domain-containing protein [Micrococcales bacterium]|nr:ATP-binding cassette domain-containing protein [Micrococcales bacterium]
MAHLLGAQSLSLTYPNRVVLDQVSLGLSDGDRVGVVGRNGDGKSSLLGLLAGRLLPDAGRVTHPGDVTIGLLEQTDHLDAQATVRQVVVDGAADHVWAGQGQAREIMTALLADVRLETPVGELSGGQMRRAALARILLGSWDVLCLDEPTNHLDMVAITWLAGHLRQRWPPGRGALLVVTHDRWFLDQVSNATWEVHSGQVTAFEGGYAAYVLRRVERDQQAAAQAQRRRSLLRKELAWLRRGAPARTSKPKFRLDLAEALIANEPPPRNQVELERLAMCRLGKDVAELDDVTAGFNGRPVLSHVNWLIGPGDRIGLLGANGAGKTTLLSLVAGLMKPMSGRVKRGKTVRAATLHQDLRELGEWEDQPVRQVMARMKASYQSGGRAAGAWTGGGRQATPGWSAGSQEMTPGAILERLGFGPAHMATLVRSLSGGQRRRLQLAMVLMEEPNVLILDEPSNDLDTDMLAAIEDLLDSWPGTLIVVTHDRYLMERTTDSQWAILDGHLRHLPGGVDQFIELSSTSPPATGEVEPRHKTSPNQPSSRQSEVWPKPGTGQPPTRETEPSHKPSTSPGQDDSATKAPASDAKAIRAAKKRLAAVERRLERLRAQRDQVNEQLIQHDPTDFAGLAPLTTRLAELTEAIAAEEDSWLVLADQAGL